jgi:sugar (pentulose or hexulose) kinase
MAGGWTIVIDVGKTLSKATLWDDQADCVAERSRPNQRVSAGVSVTLDVMGIERWLTAVLSEFAHLGPVESIVPVAHGAGAALVSKGRLLRAPLDYEWAGVGGDRAAYDRERDPFLVTGSPALPAGLNLGIQLHWLESQSLADFHNAQILPWAQCWSWLLSGVATSEVTSLGCHTDLWRPYEGEPSELAGRRGWADRFAPLAAADQVLGTLKPQWVKATGLPSAVKVYCGVHDSNAALLAARCHPAVEGHDATVLSTGTWFIAMRSPAAISASGLKLEESRDCLLNVDTRGRPVPSSRFMGGREIELAIAAHVPITGHAPTAGYAPMAGPVPTPAQTHANESNAEAAQRAAAISAIVSGQMILPSFVPGVGPFPHAVPRSVGIRSDADHSALALVYAALLADVSLDLIGSCDSVVIDGRFSASSAFTQTLASLRPTAVVLVGDPNGVARGALRLANIATAPTPLRQVAPLPLDLEDYRARWREAAVSALRPGG